MWKLRRRITRGSIYYLVVETGEINAFLHHFRTRAEKIPEFELVKTFAVGKRVPDSTILISRIVLPPAASKRRAAGRRARTRPSP